MKRIRQVNGYAIYQATSERDHDNYNCEIGNYNIYLASDVRDYGLACSYPEWEDEDSLAVVLVRCSSSRYAIACALAEELSGSTAQDMDLVLEIERRLENGEALETIRDELALPDFDEVVAQAIVEEIDERIGLGDDEHEGLHWDATPEEEAEIAAAWREMQAELAAYAARQEEFEAEDDEPTTITEEENNMTTNTIPTHTIRGREMPDALLLDNGIHFTEQYFREMDEARPFLPEPKLRYWAEQIARTIVIRDRIDGTTHDERRPTTEAEHDILYKLAYSALLGLNTGEAARQTRAAEDAVVNSIEYTCDLFFPKANGYLTIYSPLRVILEQWRSHPAEELPVIASDFPRDQDISYHVEYADGSEAWEGARFSVSYEGKVFEDDGDGLNHWHTDDSKLAHELYDYCELRGLDPRLDDEHYGVSLYRGEWY